MPYNESFIDKKYKEDVYKYGETLRKMRYTADIVFFGHSQIQLADIQGYFQSKKIVELGYGGQKILDMVIRARQISYFKPKAIFILCGINDIGLRSYICEDNFKMLCDSISFYNKDTHIYVISSLPTSLPNFIEINNKIREINNIQKAQCKIHDFEYIDIYNHFEDENGKARNGITKDGVHLTEEGYKIFYQSIEKYVNCIYD